MSDHKSTVELIDELGGRLGRDPLPELHKINNGVARPTRQDVWPPDEWERMQRIWRGEE